MAINDTFFQYSLRTAQNISHFKNIFYDMLLYEIQYVIQ